MTAAERALLDALAEGLPLTTRPFAELGARVGMTEARVIDRLRDWLATGALRRLGAFVDHRAVGCRANAMAAWEVPEERLNAVGLAVAADPAVSHCYARVARPGWPYRLYAMMHGEDREQLAARIAALTAEQALAPPRILRSLRQFKKTASTLH